MTREHRSLQIERLARGLVSWCQEFVAGVTDHNGVSMDADFEQFVAELEEALDRDYNYGPHIPDIMSDEDAVKVIDELMYRLKRVDKTDSNPVATDLWRALKSIINGHRLGGDQHSFASLPKENECPG